MRLPIDRFIVAFGLSFVLPMMMDTLPTRALGQEQGAEDGIKEVALTAPQIEHFIAARKAIAAVTEKLSDADSETPSPKVLAQLNDIAKANKFASYAEFQNVGDTIGLVMGGIDPETKKYIGEKAVIDQQIAALKADKSMSAKDKKEQLDELNDAAKSIQPVKVAANIDLVIKYYDQLIAAMPQDGSGDQ